LLTESEAALKKKGPCRNRGRLPKLTAYEKNLNFNIVVFYT